MMKKRIIALLLIFGLCFSVMADALAIRASAAVTGDGTEENPYVISTSADFSKLNKSDAYFVLGGNISLSKWTVSDFSGVLDGKGYTINLYLNTSGSTPAIAMFKNNNGTVRNLNVYCSLYHKFYEPTSSSKMASIAIVNNGVIENCVVSGNIEADIFDTSYNSLDTAGICAENNGTIRDCFVYADIYSNCNSVYCSDEIGGICISNSETGTITRCTVKNYMNADDYAAGLARRNYGKITECCTASNIVYNSTAFANNSGSGTVTNCISFSLVSEGTLIPKGCTNCITAGSLDYSGTTIADGATNCYDIGNLQLLTNNRGLVVEEPFSERDFPGFDFKNTWYITEYGVPYLRNLNLQAPQGVTFGGAEELRVGGKQDVELEIVPKTAILYSLDYQLTEGEHTAQWISNGLRITPAEPGQTRLVISDAVGGVLGFKNFEITQGVESIVVSGPTRIGLGQTIQLTAEVTPDDAVNKNIYFHIMEGSIPQRLEVTRDGKVTGLVLGDAWLYVKSEDGNVSVKYDIKVVKMPLSVQLSEESLVLYPDDTRILRAKVYPSDVEDSSYVWESSNPRVATVDASGMVTAKSYGTAVIKAVCNDGGAYSECTVTVVKRPQSASLTGPTTLGVGEEAVYTIELVPGDAVIRGDVFAEYDPTVISVEQVSKTEFKVTAVAGGTTPLHFIISDLDMFCETEVEVIRHPESVVLDAEELYMQPGDRKQIEATVMPEDTTNKDVLWTSDNPDIAEVTASGIIKAKTVGTAVVTCTPVDGGEPAQVVVHVQIPATSMELESTDITLYVDEIYEIKAKILPENATYKTVLLSAVSDLIEIDQENQSILAKAPGTAVLKVSTMDQKLKENVFVTILPANHVYGEFTFVWSEDYAQCYITRQCQNACPNTQTANCTVITNEMEATCESGGTVEYTASAVFEGKTYTDRKVVETAALGHDWAKAECERPETCGRCGKTEGEALGHTWDEGVETIEPTENSTGLMTHTCTVCGKTREETIPALEHAHHYVPAEVTPTCTEQGYTEYTCSCGDSFRDGYIDALGHTEVTVEGAAATCTESGRTDGKKCSVCGTVTVEQKTIEAKGHVYDNGQDTVCNVCGEEREVGIPSVPMFRMYDPNSGEHFYTGSVEEREILVDAGWNYEGVGFNFPIAGAPVHRLYDPVYGEHLYTMDEDEMNRLLDKGWQYENVAFNSAGTDEVPQYRLHNPNSKRGAYHFTGSEVERDHLISLGWEYQGIGWYSCRE